MAKLAAEDLRSQLTTLPGWNTVGDAIHKEFRFPGFRDAIGFVNRIADLAEAARHHPDLEIHYDRVLVSLSTHDEGGVTERDLALAREIEGATGSEPDAG
ncbi:MAG TPA: 4a-hydroxytetrahydrobiopterin dehydratase [Actinomycetota bacterium]|nr:4a-hydroxytetrahydrobiopterin dehydratase [Actinomycetota bacterium]